VRVQSDPAGRLVISGEPEHPDNPWGVTPFKKVCIMFSLLWRTEKNKSLLGLDFLYGLIKSLKLIKLFI
jgi:hypothetical protein